MHVLQGTETPDREASDGRFVLHKSGCLQK